jgi:hypothetical protein
MFMLFTPACGGSKQRNTAKRRQTRWKKSPARVILAGEFFQSLTFRSPDIRQIHQHQTADFGNVNNSLIPRPNSLEFTPWKSYTHRKLSHNI